MCISWTVTIATMLLAGCTNPTNSQEAANVECPDELTQCDSDCVDLTANAEHCGSCENACGESGACTAGLCVDLSTDVVNCGAVGLACGSSQDCCDGECLDLGSDSDCAACGDACDDGTACDASQECSEATCYCESVCHCEECQLDGSLTAKDGESCAEAGFDLEEECTDDCRALGCGDLESYEGDCYDTVL